MWWSGRSARRLHQPSMSPSRVLNKSKSLMCAMSSNYISAAFHSLTLDRMRGSEVQELFAADGAKPRGSDQTFHFVSGQTGYRNNGRGRGAPVSSAFGQ